MQVCPHCHKENAAHEAYCYACGHILPRAIDREAETNKLENIPDVLEPQKRWGTAYFDRNQELRLNFRDSNETLVITIADEITIGRAHSETDTGQPNVDLTPFDAVEKGVSRAHLKLTREYDTIVVSDLGSANSTYLNGQRLMPYEPRILRDNDELRLGHLVVRVAFI